MLLQTEEGATIAFAEKKQTAAEVAPDWLKPFCQQFQRELATQGYASCTLRSYDRAAAQFCREVARSGLRKDQLARATLASVHAAALKQMHPNKHVYKRYCLQTFVDALVEAGLAVRPGQPQKNPTARDRLRAEYEAYLRQQRGLPAPRRKAVGDEDASATGLPSTLLH